VVAIVMIGIKGLTKMTSDSKKTDNIQDAMKQVWASYNEAQQAWKELMYYKKNTEQTDSSKTVDDSKK
jgi:hypothetical protein